MNRENLPALTGLRFFAAMMIVAEHARGVFQISPTLLNVLPLDNAVSFFFVLSGFILTHVYGNCSTVEERRRFYIARFARIWPAHVACIFLLYIAVGNLERLGPIDSLPVGLLNIFLLQSWYPNYHVFFSYNAVTWSVSVEMFFYAMFPFIVAGGRLRLAFWIITSVILILLMAKISRTFGAGIFTAGSLWPSVEGFMFINPLSRLLEFIIGICFSRAWTASREWLNYSDLRANVLQIIALSLFIFSLYFNGFISGIFSREDIEMQVWMGHSGAIFLFSGFLVYAFASQRGLLRAIFAASPVVYLGEISFSLYMVHQIPIHVYYLNKPTFDLWPQGWGTLVYFASIFIMAAIMHHVVEEPCRRMIYRMASKNAKSRVF